MRIRLIHNACWRATLYVTLSLSVICAMPTATSSQDLDLEQLDSTIDRPEGSEPAVSQPTDQSAEDHPAIDDAFMDVRTAIRALEDARERISLSENIIPGADVRSEYVERISLETEYLERTWDIVQSFRNGSPVNVEMYGFIPNSPDKPRILATWQRDSGIRLNTLSPDWRGWDGSPDG
jgi:hypothetical protein